MLRVIERERPDALLPTLGGQTGLNVAVALAESGAWTGSVFALIGAGARGDPSGGGPKRCSGRRWSRRGSRSRASGSPRTVDEALAMADEVGYPVIVRPSFTLGGGAAVSRTTAPSSRAVAADGLAVSPVARSWSRSRSPGWKEFELEVMRDGADNAVIVCSIENVDPMGVHTGDSVTVAPQQTLTDREYQAMRDAALRCIRAVGVETGGSNVQFAVDPRNGRQVLIEMNPRVSRSSALASKATGFPIAKIAALLAVGYRLDEITNDITGETPAAFEPTLDYVVGEGAALRVREVPQGRPGADHDDEVGGRGHGDRSDVHGGARQGVASAREAGVRSGAPTALAARTLAGGADLLAALRRATSTGCCYVERRARRRPLRRGRRRGVGDRPWFVDQIAQVVEEAAALRGRALDALGADELREAKRRGLSDARIGALTGVEGARTCAAPRTRSGVAPCSRRSTRAPASSPRARRTTTPRTRRRRRCARRRGRAS